MEHAKHIIRAVLLLVIAAVLFIVVRAFAIPRDFETHGTPGKYRLASVAEYAEQLPMHGAWGACADCHDEEAQAVSAGKHASVSCEVCHAPLGGHVRDDEKIADMPVNRSHKVCEWCHQRLMARPKGFPQVALPGHVVEQGGEMSEEVCLECHDNAHNPSE